MVELVELDAKFGDPAPLLPENPFVFQLSFDPVGMPLPPRCDTLCPAPVPHRKACDVKSGSPIRRHHNLVRES